MQLVYDTYTGEDFNRYEMTLPQYHNNDNIRHSLSSLREHEIINKLVYDILPDKIDRDNFIKMSKLVINGNIGTDMYIFYGNGSNGKSTLLSLLSSVLDDEHSYAMDELTLNKSLRELNPGYIQHLNDKRLVVSEITNIASIFNSVLLNNKPLGIKRLFREPAFVRLNIIYVCVIEKFNDILIARGEKIINFKTTFRNNAINKNEKILDQQFNSEYFIKKHSEAFLHYVLHYKY